MKINLIKTDGAFYPYSPADEEVYLKLSDAVYQVDIKNMDLRSIKQSSSLHLWCSQIAEDLNKAGVYMKSPFSKTTIEWDMLKVKENIFKPALKAITGKDSTTKMHKKELNDVIDLVCMGVGRRGVTLREFPNKKLWDEQNGNK